MTGILAVTFELYLLLAEEGSKVPLKLIVFGNLSFSPNLYTNCYFYKKIGPKQLFEQNEINVT